MVLLWVGFSSCAWAFFFFFFFFFFFYFFFVQRASGFLRFYSVAASPAGGSLSLLLQRK
jgi:hypothetical protein